MVALAGIPLADSLPLLFTAMGDESWRVRKEAVSVLLEAQPLGDRAIEGLIGLLRAADNAGLRNSAVESLERLGESAVGSLCAHLDDPDHDMRKFVIDILGSIGCTSCLPLLVRALDDADPNVRVAAAENLGKLGDPSALPQLLKVLEGGDLWLKFTVLDALALIGVPVPLDSLSPLLNENLLKRGIYDCLGALGEADCLPLLLEGVQERARKAREAAAAALMRVRSRLEPEERENLVDQPLARLKGTPGAEGLIASLKGGDAAILEALVETIGLVGDERAALGLLTVAHEERLRGACLEAFRRIGAAALPELLHYFPRAPGSERALVAFLLGELGCRDGIGQLVTGLTDDNPSLRASCAVSLGRLAIQGVSRQLAELLEDGSPQVRDAAMEALQRVCGSDPGELALLCAELSQSVLPVKRRDAALLLGCLGDGDRLSLLAKDEDPLVRRAAIASLAKVGQPQLVPHLTMALSDEEPEVRVAAAQALAEIGGPQVLKPLLLALSDNDPWVQSAALKGLAALGDPAALPGVTALLAQARGPVLIAGLSTLAAVGGAESLAPVRAALADGDEEVVEAAMGILAGFGGDWIEEHHRALLTHPHWAVRRSFVRTVAGLWGEKALPMLEEALTNESDPLVKGEIGAVVNRLN